MTELEVLLGIHFYAHVTALAACWMAGTGSLKLLIYIKNHRDLW